MTTSLQAALEFVGRVRADETLHEQVAACGDDVCLGDLVAVAERAGYRFTAEDLQRAHTLDWRLRWARFHAS